jgi:hypothetical protein
MKTPRNLKKITFRRPEGREHLQTEWFVANRDQIDTPEFRAIVLQLGGLAALERHTGFGRGQLVRMANMIGAPIYRQPVKPPAPPAPPMLPLPDLFWDRVVEEVKQRKPLQGGFVSQAYFLRQSMTEVVIGFVPADRMSKDSLSRPAAKAALEEIMSELAGRGMTLTMEEIQDPPVTQPELPLNRPAPPTPTVTPMQADEIGRLQDLADRRFARAVLLGVHLNKANRALARASKAKKRLRLANDVLREIATLVRNLNGVGDRAAAINLIGELTEPYAPQPRAPKEVRYEEGTE